MAERLLEAYEVSPEEATVKVIVQCGCGQRSIPLRIFAGILPILCRLPVPPNTPVGSWFCHKCKRFVKVTAKMLHIGDLKCPV